MKRIKILLLVILTIMTGITSKVNADYKKVESFPSQLNNIYWTNNFNYDGSANIPFKWQNGSDKTAVYCTMLQKSLYAGPCDINSDDWDEPVKAGVAAIIKAANADNNQMTENYFYAEEAINYFLYSYDNNDVNHLPNFDKDVYNDTVWNYYQKGVAAYNEVVNIRKNKNRIAKFDKLNADHGGAKTYYYSSTSDSINDIGFKFDGLGKDGTYEVYYEIEGDKPDNVVVALKSGDNTTTNAGQKITGLNHDSIFYIDVTGLSSAQSDFKVIIKSSASYKYDIAENYNCGDSSRQNFTPNMVVETKIVGNYTEELTFIQDDIDYPDLKIIKTDLNGEKLAGASFKLVKKVNDEVIKEIVYESNDEGEVVFENLLAGRYCITEVEAPEKYIKSTEERCFTLDYQNDSIGFVDGDQGISYDPAQRLITTTYVNALSQINIAKVDENGNYVPGAKLMIVSFLETVFKDRNNLSEQDAYILNGEPLVWNTSDENPKNITGLPLGFYYVVELEAPEGYITEKLPVRFVVNNNTNSDKVVYFTNKKITVLISKVDITTKEELPGATLRILDESGNVVKIGNEELVWTSTTEQKKIEGLPAGTYYLEETQAPDGYALMTEKVKFIIDEYGKVTIDQSTDDGSTVIMTNEHTKVYISKQDITTKEELPGAHLQLFNEYGKLIEEWDSTTEPHYIEGLTIGTYTLTETTAPDGYSLNTESITFTINEDGTITGDTVMYNTPIPDIPNTLSTKSILITLGGVIIISLGIGLYLNGIKKKDQI